MTEKGDSHPKEGEINDYYFLIEKDRNIDRWTGRECDEWLISFACPICDSSDQVGIISEDPEPPDEDEILDVIRTPCHECIEKYGEDEAKRMVREREEARK